jgi:hypothetical protein
VADTGVADAVDADADAVVVVGEVAATGVADGDGGDLAMADELEEMRSANAELRRQLEAQQPVEKSRPRWITHVNWRQVVAGLLIFFAVVATVSAVSVVWAKTSLEDEDQFVATLAPLPKNEDIASVISIVVAGGIAEATGIEESMREALPAELKFLAIPVANATTTLIAGATNEFIESEAFSELWTLSLRATHSVATSIINGSQNGQVSIDLDKVSGAVVERVEATGLELPNAQTAYGSIVVYESDQLASVQALAQAIRTGGWLVPLIALVLVISAITVSRNRRRTVEILGFGTALGLILSLIGLHLGRNMLVNAIEDESRQKAAGASWDLILDRLHQLTWALFVLALIVGIAAWVMGPSSWAVNTRAWASGTLAGWRVHTVAHPNPFTSFIGTWKVTIEVVAVVLGLLFIVFGPSPSGVSTVLTAAAVFGAVVLVEVLAAPDTSGAMAPASTEAE